ncbi:MAG: helix-hairpin-helix domain-containing protein [Paludibacter sp.]|nr:helix-hairpin-helix domain-containing protein [Paludibacter sp.]
MWKDFFYFSKGQRTGIIVLVLLIIITLVVNYSLSYFFPVTEKGGTAFIKEAEMFKKSLVSRDSIRQLNWQRQYEERQRQYEEKYKQNQTYISSKTLEKKTSYVLFQFDPNTIDSASFIKLGLKPFIASNILKYRKNGGRYRSAADFSKVYGIYPDKYKELEQYIKIAEAKLLVNETKPVKRTDIIVELNTADTTLLMQVKGIGRSYAKNIIRFRQQTGGFLSVNQLIDVFGMRPEDFEKIRPFCKVNPELVQKIKVNIASVERLKSHPYINFYKAKAIYELRRKKGKLKDIADLKVLPEFTLSDLDKIKPYLNFE